MKNLVFFLLFYLVAFASFAQKADKIAKIPLLKYESSFGVNFNSDGWGIGYRYGKAKTYKVKKTWDFSFSFIYDPKQIRLKNLNDNDSKSFFYGKRIHFYNFNAIYGRQKLLTEKPYWGGVQIRFFYFGGLNIGLGKPIYLYIYDFNNGDVLSLQKFDYQKHNMEDIYGRGPYSKGLSEIEFRPGISLKLGLNVEFGPYQEKTKALEAGVIIDGYIVPVQIMSFSDPKYAMVRLFVAYRFGKRFDSTR